MGAPLAPVHCTVYNVLGALRKLFTSLCTALTSTPKTVPHPSAGFCIKCVLNWSNHDVIGKNNSEGFIIQPASASSVVLCMTFVLAFSEISVPRDLRKSVPRLSIWSPTNGIYNLL